MSSYMLTDADKRIDIMEKKTSNNNMTKILSIAIIIYVVVSVLNMLFFHNSISMAVSMLMARHHSSAYSLELCGK